jgi:hypothetical protein
MAGSQATAGLRGGAVRDNGQHTNSELTWLGPASARRPVHNKVEGVEAHLALLDTTTRRRCRGAAAKRTQSRGCRTGLGVIRAEAGEHHGEAEAGGSVR